MRLFLPASGIWVRMKLSGPSIKDLMSIEEAGRLGLLSRRESILPHMPIRVWKTVLLANISLSALLLKPSTSWKPKSKNLFLLMCHFTRCTPP